jgi:hypothetical protein
MNMHLNDDQLLDRLYGLAAHPHMESCPDCAARYREFERRKGELAEPGPVSTDFLALQRRKIYARLDERPHWGLKWAPALAAGCAIAIGLLVYRPTAAPTPASHPEAGDAQLFSEVYSMEQSTEPRAAAPIHALFEDNQ